MKISLHVAKTYNSCKSKSSSKHELIFKLATSLGISAAESAKTIEVIEDMREKNRIEQGRKLIIDTITTELSKIFEIRRSHVYKFPHHNWGGVKNRTKDSIFIKDGNRDLYIDVTYVIDINDMGTDTILWEFTNEFNEDANDF